MTDASMREAWVSTSDSAARFNLMRQMTPVQKRELIDIPNRDPLLHPFYKSRERVEMMVRHRGVVRCYIGRSMGWAPTYIILKRRDSMGGDSLSSRDVRSIRGLGIFR